MKTTAHRIQAHWTRGDGSKGVRVLKIVETREQAEQELRKIARGDYGPFNYADGTKPEGLRFCAVPSSAEFYRITGGEVIDSPLTRDQILEAVSRDDYTGLCTACGDESTGIEPDARKRKCGNCGEYSVFGADQFSHFAIFKF